MNNSFESLLKRCKARQRKKIFKVFTYFIVILSLSAYGVFYMYGDMFFEDNQALIIKKTPHTVKKVKTPKPKKILIVEKKPIVKEVLKKEPKKEPVKKKIQEPVRKDIDYKLSIDEGYLSVYKKEPKKDKVKTSKKKSVKKIPKKHLQVKPKTINPKKSNNVLNVTTKKLTSIKDLAVQYEKEPKYDLAIK